MKISLKQALEILGGLAIVASLIFVALELRQNTQATLSASYQATTDALNEINLVAATDPELIRLFGSQPGSFYELSAEDRVRWGQFLLALTRVRETLYYQQGVGTTAMQSWLREEESLRNNMRSQLNREWWETAKTIFGFAPEFRDYVDDIVAEVEASNGT